MDGGGRGKWRRRALSDREVQGLSQKTGLSGKREMARKGQEEKAPGGARGEGRKEEEVR